jgi:hypothetical protein
MVSTPKTGTDGRGGDYGEVPNSGVLQHVIREVGGGSSYPTLAKTNYAD